uniref:Uncharacterized protein n=1 Tax=Romanomermis culicivorax TaxID=13658 RepID=A0A915KSM0_ROMCU
MWNLGRSKFNVEMVSTVDKCYFVKPGSYFCSARKFTPSMPAEHARQASPSAARSMLAKLLAGSYFASEFFPAKHILISFHLLSLVHCIYHFKKSSDCLTSIQKRTAKMLIFQRTIYASCKEQAFDNMTIQKSETIDYS